ASSGTPSRSSGRWSGRRPPSSTATPWWWWSRWSSSPPSSASSTSAWARSPSATSTTASRGRPTRKDMATERAATETTAEDAQWYVVHAYSGHEEEVKAIQKQMKQEAPKIRVEFQVGESVRVVDGPFTDFHGKVDDINPERGKLKVLVNMFGRETPVELDLLQVEKVH